MMLKRSSFTLFAACLVLVFGLPRSSLLGAAGPIQEGEMAGYLLVPNDNVQPFSTVL
jgi:hypothetical protein